MKTDKIYIDPRSRILYASYYIKGLYQVYGKSNVHFSAKHFKNLNRKEEAFSFEHYFPFVVCNSNGKNTKIIIDFCDPPDISELGYNWCNIYGKINFNPSQTEDKYTPQNK